MSDKSLAGHAEDELVAAKNALAEAEILLANNKYTGSISRAYYAIFHAARAVLNVHGSAPETHRGVISEFGRMMVKTGLVDENYSQMLREAREERQIVDYEVAELELLPSAEEASKIVNNAQLFIEEMVRQIKI